MARDGDLFSRCLARGLAPGAALLIARPSGLSLIIGGRRSWTGVAIARPSFPASGLYTAQVEPAAFRLAGIDRPAAHAVFEPPPGGPPWPLLPQLTSELMAIVEQSDLASHDDEGCSGPGSPH